MIEKIPAWFSGITHARNPFSSKLTNIPWEEATTHAAVWERVNSVVLSLVDDVHESARHG